MAAMVATAGTMARRAVASAGPMVTAAARAMMRAGFRAVATTTLGAVGSTSVGSTALRAVGPTAFRATGAAATGTSTHTWGDALLELFHLQIQVPHLFFTSSLF